MTDITKNISNLRALYDLIEKEDDDVIIRGWNADDFKSEHPEKAGESTSTSSFLYIRKNAFSRFFQRISDWTSDAKRKQELAKKYLREQLDGLMNSPQIQNDIKNKLLKFSKKLCTVQGDLQVIHIKYEIESLLKSLETESLKKHDETQVPVVATILDSEGDENNAVIPFSQEGSQSAQENSYLNIENDKENLDESSSGIEIFPSDSSSPDPLTETTRHRLEVNVADEGIEFRNSPRNSHLLSIPQGITFGSKHKANEMDADFYIFPTDEQSKIDRSQLRQESVLDMTVPVFNKKSVFAPTRSELTTYKTNLVKNYKTAFQKIPPPSGSETSFSVSIAMPQAPLDALNAASQALEEALREFHAIHLRASIYIQTLGMPTSEALRKAMTRKPITA